MIGETVSLGEMCEILDTLRKPITKKFRKKGQYPYYGATGIVDYVNDYIFDETLVLIGEDGAKWDKGDQTAFIASGKYWVNNHAHVIRPFKNKLNQKFLVYYLNYIDLKPWVTGLTVPKLNQEKLKSIPIPLFTIDEQQRIVAKLDAAFADIDRGINAINYKKNKIKDLNISVLKSVFKNNWDLVKLGDVLKTGSGGTPLKARKEYYEGGKINWLQSGAVCEKEITSSKTFITQKGLNNSSAKLFPKNTVLVAMYGATAAQAGILRFESATNQAVCGIYPNKNYLPEFLYYFITHLKKELLMQVSGVAQPNLSQIKIKNIKIPIINIDEQKKILKKIDTIIDNILSMQKIINMQLVNFKILKSAVLRKELHKEEK